MEGRTRTARAPRSSRSLPDLKTRRGQLEQRLEAYKANDPEELARIEKLSEDMKQHAIRWTENLFSVKDYLVQKKGVASYQIDELFKSVGLPKNRTSSRHKALV